MMIAAYVSENKELLVELRRYFHAHPEVSLKEYHTCEKIEEELDRYGIEHRRIGDTGVYAWLQGGQGEGPVMLLRADIDALAMDDLKQEAPYCSQNQGVCHACGHDAHTATLLVAAKILKEKQAEFKGEVRFFFQQAEEIGQGARQFVKAGLLDGAKRVFGVHVASSIPSGYISLTPGPNNASCDYFKITVKGKGAHVSTPQLGVDALYVASQIVVNLQSVVSRMTDPIDTVILGIGKMEAGTQYNIVANQAVLEGTTRSFSKETRERVNGLVVSMSKDIASLYGAQCEVLFEDYAAPLINDADACQEAYQVCARFLDEDHIITNREKALSADDFADYLEKVKGVYAYLGTYNADLPHTGVAHHNGYFDIDEDTLQISCQLYVDYALSVLNED